MINAEINIKYKHYIEGNPRIKDSRLISALLFLIILKYKSLLINYEKMNKNEKEEEFIFKKSIIKDIFNKFIDLSQKEILFMAKNINKVKEDKKMDIIIDKEELKSKIFKDYNKNYYKYLLDQIIKNKNINIKNIKEDIEKKFIQEDNAKNINNVNFLKNLNINDINNGLKNNKKEKKRKDSYGYYNEDKEEDLEIKNIIPLTKKKSSKNLIKALNNNIEDNKKENNIHFFNSYDFENTKYPILCTKRDLILIKFGHVYYKDYFNDNKFRKMKKLFLYRNSPDDEDNNYYGFQKLMKNKYPYVVKNYTNNSYYYPRVFYRPYTKFFENKYFPISHSYFEKEINNNHDYKIFNLKYGHGLLNQYNFKLFRISNDTNEDYWNIMDVSLNSSLSNGSGDKIDNASAISNEEYEKTLKLYEKRNNKPLKSFHKSNKNLLIANLGAIKEENIPIKNNIRSKFHKKSTKKRLTISCKSNPEVNIFNSSKKVLNNLFECELISPKNVKYGLISLNNKNFFIFQVDTKFKADRYETEKKYLISSSYTDLEQEEKQIIIPYNQIFQIIFRKFIFFNQAFELFLYNGKSYFFNLYQEEIRNKFMKKLKEKLIVKNDKCDIIEDSNEYFNKKKYLNLWLEGKKTTLEYLLLINKFSNRSYNFLSQYLVMPWLLTDFNDIYNVKNYRNMSFPISAQTQQSLDNITTTYNYQSDSEYRCYFPMLYSTSMHINNYLLRCYPYTNNQIKCQNGKFEEPARQIDNIQTQCTIFKQMYDATMELIPEFYFIPEIFLNMNFCCFGKSQRKNKSFLINNIKLGEGFKSILELIVYHQNNLNSEYFSSQINKWIDNIFGENQITDKKNVFNSFPQECYEKYVREEINQKLKELNLKKENLKNLRESNFKIKNEPINNNNIITNTDAKSISKTKIIGEIKNLLMKAYFYGQCPSQLFTKSHPCYCKKSDLKKYSLSNIDNLQLILKNDYIKIDDSDFLYIKESYNGNYLYILTDNNLFVYNKLLKIQSNLSLYNIDQIYPPFSFSYNTNIKNTLKTQYMYKYLIFEVFECKCFFMAGFLDNSFRIYSKEKDKNIMYSIYTESKVTCIKKITNSNSFFTGHKNGKIIKWDYTFNDKDNLKKDRLIPINVYRKKTIYGHNTFVKIIEINIKFNVVISVGKDEIIYIRKLFDLELLNYIKFNKIKNRIIDINFHNQFIILTVFKQIKQTVFIYIYSLNGMKLGKLAEQIKMPISIISELDEVFIFGALNMYLVKTSLKEKTSLLSITNNLIPSYYEGGKGDNSNNEEEKDKSYKFNEDLNNVTPISYFYDTKNHVLFCLFANGRLHRINIIRNI